MKGLSTIGIVAILTISIIFIGMASPAAVGQSGIDLTDENEIALEELNVELTEGSANYGQNGQAQYNVIVSGEISENNVPLLYPVRLTFYDTSDYNGAIDKTALESSSDVRTLDQQTTVLNPTQPDSFVPTLTRDNPDAERVMVRDLQVNLAFPDLLDQSSAQKDVTVIAESTRSANSNFDTDTVDITGALPEGVSSSVIQQDEDLNIFSEILFVDSYRISPDNSGTQFGENTELPVPSDRELSGEIQEFSNMRSPFGNSTIVSGQNNLSFVTSTGNVPNGAPYTVTITYNMLEGDSLSVNPINPVGQGILEDSTYRLPADPSDENYCREIDVEDGTSNMCVLYLNQGEVSQISSIGELFLHYKSDESTSVSITCQSIISGYLPNDRESCGVDPANTNIEDPTADVVIDAEGLVGDPADSNWTSPDVTVLANDDQSVDHNLRYDVRESIDGSFDAGDHVVRVFRESDHVNSQGEIEASATPIYEQDVADYSGESWNQFVEQNRLAGNLSTEYHFLLCQSGSTVPTTCGIDTNVAHDTITFKKPGSPVDLNIKSPLLINQLPIENVREDEFEIRTETIEIPDSDYHVGSEWEIRNSGDPVIENFNGTVTQQVTVDNVFEDKREQASNGVILQEAIDRRADSIPANQWSSEVSISQTLYRDTVLPASQDLDDRISFTEGWVEAAVFDDRTVQIGTQQQNFSIVDGDAFQARVSGEEQWYPLRNASTDRQTNQFVFDTRLQSTDPDRCLNCLATEDPESAADRLDASQGGVTDVVGTSGINAWVQASEEPTIVNGEELSSSFFRRSEIVSNTLSYRNIGVDDDSVTKYRQRQSNKETTSLYQWEYAPEILEPLFERPTYDGIQRYTRHRYDVTYTFTADVQNEDIYRYERDVYGDGIEYQDGHIAWVDISRSTPSEEIEQFEVQFQGAEQPIRVDWVEGVHSVPPQRRDEAINDYCGVDANLDQNGEYPVGNYSSSQLNQLEFLDGLYNGQGGTPVIQTCEKDGEEKIVRIGQEYNETGIFSYNVNLVNTDSEGQGIVEVIGERPDGDGRFPTEIGSEPEIADFNTVNDKIDYNIGTVALNGTIVSQDSDLDSDYELTVTPADNIDTSAVSCSELGAGYSSVMNKSVTESYVTGASFRQLEKCESDQSGNASSIDLRSRTAGYQFESIESGIIQECSDIPTVGQSGEHDGYTDTAPSNDEAKCVLTGDGDGPSGFTLYTTEYNPLTEQEEVDYNSVPAGAFRAKSFATGETSDLCQDVRIEDDGAMICAYESNGDVVDVRFGTRTLGEWTSASDTVSDLLSQTNARKAIWQSDQIVPVDPGQYEEDFTTTINPRNAGFTPDQRDVEFTLELRDRRTSEVVDSESVTVRLCSAGQIENRDELPRSNMGSYECENFDTMMTGEDDFQDGFSVEDAVQDYTTQGADLSNIGPVNYTITSVQNDACPYTHEFPRDQSSLINNQDKYRYTINANSTSELNDEQSRIKEEITDLLGNQYSPLGPDPCSRVENPKTETPTFVQNTEDFTIRFGKNAFAKSQTQEFTRIAGLEDLHKITQNPVQSRWTKDDMGSAVRLGHPILLEYSPTSQERNLGGVEPQSYDVNDNLVAHYTFNHDPSKSYQITTHSSSIGSNPRTFNTTPNQFVIQDVGMTETSQSPDGREQASELDGFNNVRSEGIYNARLWHGSPCHAEGRYTNGSIYNPEVIQPVENNIGPSYNSYAFNTDPCDNLMTSTESEYLADYEYANNRLYSFASQGGRVTEGGGSDISEEELTTNVPSNQAAYLPVAPTDSFESNYTINDGTVINAYESVQDNYAQQRGAFGGNALRLDKSSWMMISPPCESTSNMGEDLDGTAFGLTCGDNPGPEQWRGGWHDAHTDDGQISPSIQKTLGDEYTVSFWINTKPERDSMDSVSRYDGSSVSPLRTIYSTSEPGVTDVSGTPNPNIIPSTAELTLSKAPRYISIEDIPDQAKALSSKLSGDRVQPVSWDYPGHFKLLDTARACMSSTLDTLNKRPVMCEVFEASNSENAVQYNDLTTVDYPNMNDATSTPPFMDAFRAEMIDRTVWQSTLDWPVGSAVERGSEGFPAFDPTSVNANADTSYADCFYATQPEREGSDQNCYETGRYAYSGHNNLDGIRADNGFGDSNWQHVAITYNAGSGNFSDFNVKINGQTQASAASNVLDLNPASKQDSVRVGQLHENGVMSLGAVYQGPSYNMNPNNLTGSGSGSYVPYIHASQGEVLIDEVRIYDTELSDSEVQSKLPLPKSSVQHNLPSDAPMYTGTLETEPISEIPNGTQIEEILGDEAYRTFEVNVDASSDGPAAYNISIIPCTSGDEDDCITEAAVNVGQSAIPNEDRTQYSQTTDVTNPGGGSVPTAPLVDEALGSAGSEYLDVQLTSTSDIVRFNGDQLTDEVLRNVTNFKLDIELGTPYVDSSPIINSVELSPSGDPFSSCGEIADRHPGAQGLYGTEFDMNILDSSGVMTEVNCDMERAGGGWTQFAWIDTSEGDVVDKDTESGDPVFMDNTTLSECDLNDTACFAGAGWDEETLNNVTSSDGGYPQVMIRAVDDGEVVDWAAFQINEDAHQVIEPNLGVDSIRMAPEMASIFAGTAGEVTGGGPEDAAGMNVRELRGTSASSDVAGLYEECLHPFDNNGEFDRRCVSHVKQTTNINSNILMAEMSGARIGGSVDGDGPRYEDTMLQIRRSNDDNSIIEMDCLGLSAESEIDRCEFYYRTGDAFSPLTQQNGISSLSGVFDLDDYSIGDRPAEEINNTVGPRAYTFKPAADTRINSLYSSYSTEGTGGWIGLYSVDGTQLEELLGSANIGDGEFVEHPISPADPVVANANETYAIVQSPRDYPADGDMIGYPEGSNFDVSAATSENPLISFSPISDSKSFRVVGNSGAVSSVARTPNDAEGGTLDADSSGKQPLPRVGFDYDVVTDNLTQVNTIPTIGYSSISGGERQIGVFDLNSETRRQSVSTTDSVQAIAPDRRGEGIYVADSGSIVEIEYSDYDIGYDTTQSDTYSRSDSQANVVVDGLPQISDMHVDENGQVAYTQSRLSNTLYAHDLADGSQLWQHTYDASRIVGMSVGSESIYAASESGTIFEVDKQDGTATETDVNLPVKEDFDGNDVINNPTVLSFDVNEEAEKVVLATTGTPEPLSLRLNQLDDSTATPSEMPAVEGITTALTADYETLPNRAEVAIADGGRTAVWMGDTDSYDGPNMNHGITTYNSDNEVLNDIDRYYDGNPSNYETQIVEQLDIQENGNNVVVGTDGRGASARVRVYNSGSLDRAYGLNAFDNVYELEVFGRAP